MYNLSRNLMGLNVRDQSLTTLQDRDLEMTDYEKGDEEQHIPPEYKAQRICTFLSWAFGALVLALSAIIISRISTGSLRPAAIYNLALGALQITCILGFDIRLPRPRSLSDPRPSIGSLILIGFKTLAWGAAFALMFVYCNDYDHDSDPTSKRTKRRYYRSHGPVSTRAIAIACGCFGVLTFMIMLVLWTPVLWAFVHRYTTKTEAKKMYSTLIARKYNKVHGNENRE
ncbi:hypothetical protein P175DRAFT_022642 [Aspergillus ochraceoroseus IBT 24754]|uniref:Uncharacterized protein n=1 Tax=Aspergillus ochraceoroseus IBT 24754 TaxID=1392256 RepID=A0A2T5M6P8_9EURO|nr:uncharacterized protein P175DRAFT_022642 [Aspergillus ochraceoroseus IBT 24754]PTU24186.1 hypothetical protein P175DRAFT_022642 [Aspergillus ochraceoroseus IBT 24754]